MNANVNPRVNAPVSVLVNFKESIDPKFRNPELIRIVICGYTLAVQDQRIVHQIIPRNTLVPIVPARYVERALPDNQEEHTYSTTMQPTEFQKGMVNLTNPPGFSAAGLLTEHARQGFVIVEGLIGLDDPDEIIAMQNAILPDPELTEQADEHGVVDLYHQKLQRIFKALRSQYAGDARMREVVDSFAYSNQRAYTEKTKWLRLTQAEVLKVTVSKYGRPTASPIEAVWARECGFVFDERVKIEGDLSLVDADFIRASQAQSGAGLPPIQFVLPESFVEDARNAAGSQPSGMISKQEAAQMVREAEARMMKSFESLLAKNAEATEIVEGEGIEEASEDVFDGLPSAIGAAPPEGEDDPDGQPGDPLSLLETKFAEEKPEDFKPAAEQSKKVKPKNRR